MKFVPLKTFVQFIIPFYLLLCPSPVLAVETDQHSIEFYLSAAEANVKQGKFFQALENYQIAIERWGSSADMNQQMSVLYYHLGFVDKAIEATQKSLESAPKNDYLNHRLGILYFVDNDLLHARKQFVKALIINPGFADSHYYLAHVFLRQNLPAVAAMFAYSAHQLGHPASDILQLLEADSPPPGVWLKDESKIYFRQIFVKERAQSEAIMARLKAGDQFENIARMESDSTNGGYSGGYLRADLQPWIVSSLAESAIPGSPLVVESANSYTIVQKIAPIDWSRITAMYEPSPLDATKNVVQGSVSASSSGQEQFHYAIQLGAFREKKYARKEIEKLTVSGRRGDLVETLRSEKPLYLVYTGNFSTHAAAKSESIQLKESGFDPYIVKRK